MHHLLSAAVDAVRAVVHDDSGTKVARCDGDRVCTQRTACCTEPCDERAHFVRDVHPFASVRCGVSSIVVTCAAHAGGMGVPAVLVPALKGLRTS